MSIDQMYSSLIFLTPRLFQLSIYGISVRNACSSVPSETQYFDLLTPACAYAIPPRSSSADGTIETLDGPVSCVLGFVM